MNTTLNSLKRILCQAKIQMAFLSRYTSITLQKGAAIMATHHAIQRVQERTGLNQESSERLIEDAIRKGRNAIAFTAKEREYLLQKEAKKGYWTVVYNTYCFIFGNDGICVTMYPLPKWFNQNATRASIN